MPSLVRYLYYRPVFFFAGLLTLVSGWYIWQPDSIPVNDGFGFEGAYFYRAVAKDFYQTVFVTGVNAYSIQRILPFGLLHAFFRLTGLPFTDAVMLRYCEWYNWLLGLLIIYYWHRVARLLHLNQAAVWSGYLGLLVNFATLKYDTYVPFTYDRTALLVGLMSLYYHLARQAGRVLCTALLSLLVWPTALYCNIVLLLLPPYLQLSRTGNKPVSMLWAAGSSLAFATLCIVTLYIKHIEVGLSVAPTEHSVLPLSIGLITLYVAFTQYGLARVLLASPANLLKLIRVVVGKPKCWAAVMVLLTAYLGLTQVLGRPETVHLNTATFLVNLVYGAVTRPLQNIVAHSNYYGLSVVLALLCWRRLLLAVRRLGLAVGGLMVLLLLLSVNCETRQLANLLPILVVVVAMVVHELNPRPWAVMLSGLLFLIHSKVWLRINAFDATLGHRQDQFPLGNSPGSEYTWNSPFQAYWMNIGPWTSNQFLAIEAGVLLVLLVVVFRLYSTNKQSVGLNRFRRGFSATEPDSAPLQT